ncbi:MAG: YdcF family protein [Rhodospirillales bacterium]|nr:YdcF family protein [Rhodospirillales bacterium]
MFFTLSKVLWFVADPGNLLLTALVVGVALLATRWRRGGQRLLAVVALAAVFVAVVPAGSWLIGILEDRFPAIDEPPAHVDGVVVLGGVVEPALSAARGRAAVGGAVERLFAMAALSKRYPQAKLIFSGGSGSLIHQDKKEARLIAPLLSELGVDPARVILEDASRNTAENAELSRRLAQPKGGETWLLVTSAFHMPRAVGCFRRAGWNVVPYPVDHLTAGESAPPIQFDFGSGLNALRAAVHEYLGLFFYWLDGKTDALFPAPD